VSGRQRKVVLLGQRQLRGLLLQGLQLCAQGRGGLKVIGGFGCIQLCLQSAGTLAEDLALRGTGSLLQDAITLGQQGGRGVRGSCGELRYIETSISGVPRTAMVRLSRASSTEKQTYLSAGAQVAEQTEQH
jgi:hypothetical protein